MSLKSIWKERAVIEHVEAESLPDITFTAKTFEEIADTLRMHLKQRLGASAAQAIDDPTSVFSSLINSIAACNADLHKQAEVLLDFYGKAKKS